ncbi:MAG: anti-sigma F factor [Bacillota bacterium]|nr:anti-sigma F factor [Bacillota bacterium]
MGELHNDKRNILELSFSAVSANVSLARLLAAAAVSDRDITMAEIDEIKVAVSEAVSNAIIHGYGNDSSRTVRMRLEVSERQLMISVIDEGVGIADIEQALKPSFSSSEERMGLGFAFMQSFMDAVEVISQPQQGTTVRLYKNLQ